MRNIIHIDFKDNNRARSNSTSKCYGSWKDLNGSLENNEENKINNIKNTSDATKILNILKPKKKLSLSVVKDLI